MILWFAVPTAAELAFTRLLARFGHAKGHIAGGRVDGALESSCRVMRL